VAAAVFTTLAIVPPGGGDPRGLRVEQLENPVDRHHPLLARVAIEDALTGRWTVPREATLRLSGGNAASTVRVQSRPGLPFAFAEVPAPSDAPLRLRVDADAFHANAIVPPERARVPFVPRELPRGEHGIEVRVEGGLLVPEVPGTVLVRADDGNDGAIELTGTDDSVQIERTRAMPDLCGVCVFAVTVRGLDAHVVVRLAGEGPDRIARRAIPVAPGAIAVALPDPDTLRLTTPVGGQPVFVLLGDPNGFATHWQALRFDDVPDANATVAVSVPRDAAWALASLSPAFESSSGLWLRAPPHATSCTATTLGDRFVRATTTLPEPPRVRVLFDGARIAAIDRAQRQRRFRRISLVLAALGIAMLIGLIVAANLRREPDALRDAALASRARVWVAIGGSLALLLGGAVLLSAFALRQ
jgi:hypothetical protein